MISIICLNFASMILYWGDLWNEEDHFKDKSIYHILFFAFKILNIIIQLTAYILFIVSFNYLAHIKVKELASQRKQLNMKHKLVIGWVLFLILMLASTQLIENTLEFIYATFGNKIEDFSPKIAIIQFIFFPIQDMILALSLLALFHYQGHLQLQRRKVRTLVYSDLMGKIYSQSVKSGSDNSINSKPII